MYARRLLLKPGFSLALPPLLLRRNMRHLIFIVIYVCRPVTGHPSSWSTTSSSAHSGALQTTCSSISYDNADETTAHEQQGHECEGPRRALEQASTSWTSANTSFSSSCNDADLKIEEGRHHACGQVRENISSALPSTGTGSQVQSCDSVMPLGRSLATAPPPTTSTSPAFRGRKRTRTTQQNTERAPSFATSGTYNLSYLSEAADQHEHRPPLMSPRDTISSRTVLQSTSAAFGGSWDRNTGEKPGHSPSTSSSSGVTTGAGSHLESRTAPSTLVGPSSTQASSSFASRDDKDWYAEVREGRPTSTSSSKRDPTTQNTCQSHSTPSAITVANAVTQPPPSTSLSSRMDTGKGLHRTSPTTSSTSIVTREENPSPTRVRSGVSYRMEDHTETSAPMLASPTSSTSSTDSNDDQNNMLIEHLTEDPFVVQLFEITTTMHMLVQQGERLLLQMIGTLFQEWQRLHEGQPAWWNFARLVNAVPVDTTTDMEIGVALPPTSEDWSTMVFHLATSIPPPAHEMTDENSLMGLTHRVEHRGDRHQHDRPYDDRRGCHRSRSGRRTISHPPRRDDAGRNMGDARSSLSRRMSEEGSTVHRGTSRTTCTTSRTSHATSRDRTTSTWHTNASMAPRGERSITTTRVREPSRPPPSHVLRCEAGGAGPTLSMCRYTWRNLLCMSEAGPCGDVEEHIDHPLDNQQIANIQATVEDLTPAARLLFYSSFVQFILELSHQVALVMTTDNKDYLEAGGDESALMQSHAILVDKTRLTISSIQRDMDKDGTHRHQKAAALLRMLSATWGSSLTTSTSDEVQNLLAMLLVYRDEPYEDHTEEATFQDNDWARRWEQQLYFYLVDILPVPNHAQLVEDSPADPIAPHAALDGNAVIPPVPEGHRTDEGEPSSLELQARDLQRREDRIMMEAMSRPPKMQRRLQLRIQLQTGSSSSASSSTCLHVPVPQDAEATINVQMRLSTTTSSVPNDEAQVEDEPEGISLMQRGPPTNRPLLQSLTAPMSRRVNQLVRQRIMDRLQVLLRECHMLMREQNDLLQIFSHTDSSNISTIDENQEAAANTIADAYLSVLQTQMHTLLAVPMDIDPYDVVVQIAQGLDPEECRRGLRLVRHKGAPRTSLRGTPEDIQKVANHILDETQSLIFQVDHHGRADMIRDYVATLAGGLQVTASKAMVLVLLLAHHLPQPWPQCNPTSQARARGRNYAMDVMADLNETFLHAAVDDLNERPFGVQEVVPLLPALSPLTMEIITFLEDAEYLLEDITPNEETEVQDSLDSDLAQAVMASREHQTLQDERTSPMPTEGASIFNSEAAAPHDGNSASTTQYGGSSGSHAGGPLSGTQPMKPTTPLSTMATLTSTRSTAAESSGRVQAMVTQNQSPTTTTRSVATTMGSRNSTTLTPTSTSQGRGPTCTRSTTMENMQDHRMNNEPSNTSPPSTEASRSTTSFSTLPATGEHMTNASARPEAPNTGIDTTLSTSTSPKRRKKGPVPEHQSIKRFIDPKKS